MSSVNFFSSSEHVTESLYRMVCPMLASRDCIKCVSENDESIFTTDVICLLSHIDIEHPVGEVILQALESHKKNYKTSSKTLLFMITRIMKLVTQLHSLGIPVKKSLKIINACISQLKEDIISISIPVSILTNKQTNEQLPFQSTESYGKHPAEVKNVPIDFRKIKDTKLDDQRLFRENSLHRDIETALKSTSDDSNVGLTPDFSEADPLVLKMTSVQKSEPVEDISWFFTNSMDKPKVKARQKLQQDFQNKMPSLCGDALDTFSQQLVFKKSNSLKSPSENSFKKYLVHASNGCSSNEDIKEDGEEINQLSFHHCAGDKNEHDSDFEDCFDDIENRKHVSLKVEPAPHLSTNASEEDNQEQLLFHNVRKQFPSATDFDYEKSLTFFVPEDLEKNKQTVAPTEIDDEFADCFADINIKEVEHSSESVQSHHDKTKGNTLFSLRNKDENFHTSIKSFQNKGKTDSVSGYDDTPKRARDDSSSSSIQTLNNMLEAVAKRKSMSSTLIGRNSRNCTRTQNNIEEVYEGRIDQPCATNNYNAKSTVSSINTHKIEEKSKPNNTIEMEHHHDLLSKILAKKQKDLEVNRSHQISISSRYLSDKETNQRPAYQHNGKEETSLSLSSCVPAEDLHSHENSNSKNVIGNSSLSVCCSSDNLTRNQLSCQDWKLSLPEHTHLLVDTEFSSIVEQILRHQMKEREFAGFNLKLVNCVYASGSNSSLYVSGGKCTVFPGIILPCDSDTLQKLSPFNSMKIRRAVLVKGDLTPLHHHKGYKPTLPNKVIVSTAADCGSGEEKAWTASIL
ncbi:hypothetical protein EGW08_022780, partial [Elysia chlorotica]